MDFGYARNETGGMNSRRIKPAVTFVKSRSRIQNQTEVTAVNHNGELGWISSGSTWTNCTERGNKRNQMTLESVLEQSIQLKPS